MADAPTVENGVDGAAPPKTAKQLEKEKKQQAKLEKFLQKQEKKNAVNTGDNKQKTEVIVSFIYLF